MRQALIPRVREQIDALIVRDASDLPAEGKA